MYICQMHVDCTNSILSIEWIQSHDLIDIKRYYYIVLSKLRLTLGNEFTLVNILGITRTFYAGAQYSSTHLEHPPGYATDY